MTNDKRTLAVGACAAVLIAAVGTSPASADDLRTVAIGWPAAISQNLAHVIFAEDLGIFAEEGLRPEVTVMQGSFNVVQQILAGGFQTGYVGVEAVVLAAQPGTPAAPAKFVYNYYRDSIWEFAVLAESDIETVADFKGKAIGIGGPAFGNVPMTKAMIASQGIDQADVSLLSVGVGGPAFQALRGGDIDVLNLWDTMDATLERAGTSLRRIPVPEVFQGLPSHGLLMSNELIEQDPEFVAAFGRAWSKSEVACRAAPEACLTAFWKRFPEQKPDMPLDEALAYELPLMNMRTDKQFYFAEGQEPLLGAFSDDNWNKIISALSAGGAITKTDIPVDSLYTNQFVEEYNDFDPAEVEAMARAYKN